MKRKERLKAFENFYFQTYKSTMQFLIEKTGDFLNLEDLAAKTYNHVYRFFMKTKAPHAEGAYGCLHKSINIVLDQYLKRNQKNKQGKRSAVGKYAISDLLDYEYILDEATIEKQMLRQEILSYISKKPIEQRRLFSYIFYFVKTIQEAASVLRLQKERAEEQVALFLEELNDQILIDYEQEVKE